MKTVSNAPKGENIPDSLEPPLNMMSFMISVKFLLMGEAQILFRSGKFTLRSYRLKNGLNSFLYMELFFFPLKKK